ncbi:hypothetical protein JX265_013450 [Neoarthrinium moseri]|uniref:Rhodopsin domain-containing protein n=1 Tax=Neoarthrinium moseri TaxID=1658444 RepID=A0A9Q0AIJ5_9PEZI|nr:uncharacterized protein JN550_013009 [Neoarthrinium moseri]KAI1841350.1 hypothetical protein JX266_012431 [Neoarthrinium moseri]KAI1850171.1 hypothetical protein JX265_013450 [Neoarthrinium moseri]KAI1857811.1 hypothetical protein JN550_013009 [Neoarthrinium moseri]
MAATSGYDENEPMLDILDPSDYDNLNDPIPWSNKKPTIMGLTITFLLLQILSWSFVCFRLWVRFRIVRSPWWDDLFVVLYLITGTLGSVALLISIPFGAGQHLLYLTVGQAGRYLVSFYIFNASLNLAATFIKLSLLCQYLRVFEKGTWPHRMSKVTIVLVSLWGLAYTMLAFIPCWPVADYWYSPPDAKCWAYGAWSTEELMGTFYSHTALNMVFDIVILTIPFHLYFKPCMTLKMRIGLLALLLMGALVTFLSIWRLQTLVEHKAGRYPTHDPTWYGPISLILAVLECDCASICASVPIFWPVLSPYLGAIFVTQEVSVEHEYRRTDEESKVQTSSNSLPRPGSQTELKPLESPPTNMNYFYDDEGSAPLESTKSHPGVHTRVRSDSMKDKKRGWTKI